LPVFVAQCDLPPSYDYLSRDTVKCTDIPQALPVLRHMDCSVVSSFSPYVPTRETGRGIDHPYPACTALLSCASCHSRGAVARQKTMLCVRRDSTRALGCSADLGRFTWARQSRTSLVSRSLPQGRCVSTGCPAVFHRTRIADVRHNRLAFLHSGSGVTRGGRSTCTASRHVGQGLPRTKCEELEFSNLLCMTHLMTPRLWGEAHLL
jgi:hypothetical protein